MEIKTKIKYGNLKKAIKALSQHVTVKVGLLANTPGVKGYKGSDSVLENMDIAGLGAVHEFGAEIDHPGGTPYFINEWGMATFVKKDSFYGQLLIQRGQITKPHHISIPARPWLSMPLQRNNGADLRKRFAKETGGFDGQFVDDLLFVAEDPKKIAHEIGTILGVVAQDQILEAFETGGFGEWQPDAPATIAKKGSEDPLIDKGRLKGAVTFEVEGNG